MKQKIDIKHITVRAFSVLMAVFMLASAWVFLAPTKANAATAGSYTMTFSISVSNKADKQGNLQESYFTIYYKPNNGTGTETNMKYDLKSNWTTVGLNNESSKSFSVTVPGFPTKVKAYHDAVWTDICEFKITNVKVGSQSGTGSIKNQNIKSGGIGNSAYNKDVWTCGDYPYASTVSISGENSVTAPHTDNTTKSYSATIKDQYGVVIGTTPTWSISSNNWGGCSVSPTTGNDSTTLTVPGKTDGSETTVKIKASGTFNSKTASDEKEITIKPTGHSLTKTEAKAATCTATGNNAYWTCSRCKKVFSDSTGKTETTVTAQTIAALGHSWNNGVVTTPANCVDKGVKTFTCTRDNCGATKTEDIAINPDNHKSIVTDPAVEATTENVGLTEGKHCSVCNTVIVAQEVIAPVEKSEVYEGATTGKIEGSFIGVTADEPSTKVSTTTIEENTTATGSYGTVTILNGKATYKVTTMQVKGADTFWLLKSSSIKINAVDTTVYYYQEIKIIPADRLYYEDTFEAGDNSGIKFSEGWITVGNTTDSAVSQLEDKTFEEAYNSCLAYSAGNAKKVTVSNSARPYVEFTFSGTGFDVISATSSKTGTFTVTITGNGATQKKIVDTYYGYAYGRLCLDETNHTLVLGSGTPLFETTKDESFDIRANGKYYTTENTGKEAFGWIENASNVNSLYQVPIISIDNLNYGTYTVKVEARYSSMFDHAKNGSYDLIFDAVRIHNPGGDSVNALRPDNATYQSFREVADDNSMICVDGREAVNIKENEDILKVSPNNELYVSNGQSIAFDLEKEGTPKDILVGMRSINGTAVTVEISDGITTREITVSTATELYYSISEMGGTVSIRNNGDGILSLTNLKVVTDKNAESQAKSYMSVSAETAPRAMAILKMLDSNLSINPDTIETATDDSGKITLTVKTSENVAQLIIYDADGNEVTADEINSIANGDEITWTVTLTATESGTYTYSIQGAYENGYTSEDPVEITVKVELPETAPEVIPDDEDDTEENGKLTLFELIIRIIKRIIYRVFGVSYE